MKYVSYIRVSTDRQGQSSLGLEAQQAAVDAFVQGKGEIIANYVEVESGKVTARPELENALAEAKRSGATLLIAKLDRLARNVAFIANLLEAGVEVTAVDMPEANGFMFHIMTAVAEQEVLAISERTKAALAAAKVRGTLLGMSNPKIRASMDRAVRASVAARTARAAIQPHTN